MTRKQWRKFGTAFALASLAIRLLIAAVHVPPAIAADADAASFLTQTILCTASGYRVVQLDQDGQPVDPDNAPPLNAGVSCPVCTTLSAAPMAPAPPEITLAPPRLLIDGTPTRLTACVTGRKPLVTGGCDPPLQA